MQIMNARRTNTYLSAVERLLSECGKIEQSADLLSLPLSQRAEPAAQAPNYPASASIDRQSTVRSRFRPSPLPVRAGPCSPPRPPGAPLVDLQEQCQSGHCEVLFQVSQFFDGSYCAMPKHAKSGSHLRK